MDGTHPKVPAPFKQLYFIGTRVKDEHILPAVFCLLPDHSSETYSVVLNFLKNSISNSPDNFLLDFEVSVFKSIVKFMGMWVFQAALSTYSKTLESKPVKKVVGDFSTQMKMQKPC